MIILQGPDGEGERVAATEPTVQRQVVRDGALVEPAVRAGRRHRAGRAAATGSGDGGVQRGGRHRGHRLSHGTQVRFSSRGKMGGCRQESPQQLSNGYSADTLQTNDSNHSDRP